MNINKYISNKKKIQSDVLKYVEDNNNIEEYYQNVCRSLKNQQILEEKNELKSFLYLINNISNNHRRSQSFIDKIEGILKYCQKAILSFISNKEIFDIFSNNKRILVFLIKEKIIVIDNTIFEEMKNEKYKEADYIDYFLPELAAFEGSVQSIPNQKEFEQKRKNGENDQKLCQLIRQDSIKEFQNYVSQNKISLDSIIEKSIYETNQYLIENQPTIIEYAAFFGSFKIFNFLIQNEVELLQSIWIYAMHGNNVDLFQILDENSVKPEDNSYEECLEESIKCHHNEIANIIIDKFLDEKVERQNRENNEDTNIYAYSFHYYNYSYFPESFDNKYILHYLIDYDYFDLFKLYLSKKSINYGPYIKYAKKIGKIEYYNILNCLRMEESKPAEKAIPTSARYNNFNLSFCNDKFQIDSTTINIKSMKKDYFLGLHEAFSCTPDETQFMKSSDIFKSIVESKRNDDYTSIAKEIQSKLSGAKESSKCRNELSSLITSLCSSISSTDVNRMINEFGGMINYIIPKLADKRLLSPKKTTVQITEPFIAAGLILFYHEIVKSDLFRNTPFSFWKLMKSGEIKLTYIAKKRIMSSLNPSIILLFGIGRTGKSTIASNIVSGMKYNLRETLFKSAASIEACTHNINALGPIKCSELANSYEIDKYKNNANMNRDIFIVDSEGVESFDETPWLEQALFALFPINTVTFYVSIMYNPRELEKYTRYLNLIQIIGGIKINHGFGYILNRGSFDGGKILDKILAQNNNETKKIVKNYSDSTIKLDESHSKYFTVLDFNIHHDEYFLSLKEVVKFIIDMIINEGFLLDGSMMIQMLEKFAIKANENQYLRNHGQTFETLFLQIIDDKMKKSIDNQKELIERNIASTIEPYLVQDMTLDINSCLLKLNQENIINNAVQTAIANTLPSIPQKYPYLIESAKSKVRDIIRNSVSNSKQKILSKRAMEVPDLGCGFSITDGSFKMRVFDLKTASYLYERDLGDGAHVAYRLPENVIIECVPTIYQKDNYNLKTSINNYVSEIASKVGGGNGFNLSISKFGFDKVNNFANSLLGLAISTDSPEKEASISVKAYLLAKVRFNNEPNLGKCLNYDIKSHFNELEKLVDRFDIKSQEVKDKVIEIFSNYGESVAINFLIGFYEIDISHNDGTKIESGGQSALSSSECRSSGINIAGKLGFRSDKSTEKSNMTSQYANVKNISQSRTIISCGSPSNPATFICDFVKNPMLRGNESSFVPLSRFAPPSIVKALDYWAGKWDAKPTTVTEYLNAYDLKSLPTNATITLFKNNVPFNVYVNDFGKIVLQNSEIVYHYYREYDNKIENQEDDDFEVEIDPGEMTICNLTKVFYTKRWKRRTGHHKRAEGVENLTFHIQLGPLWKFEDNITIAHFEGDALNYAIINNPNSHFLSIEFGVIPGGNGKNWDAGPKNLKIKNKAIKVMPA